MENKIIGCIQKKLESISIDYDEVKDVSFDIEIDGSIFEVEILGLSLEPKSIYREDGECIYSVENEQDHTYNFNELIINEEKYSRLWKL